MYRQDSTRFQSSTTQAVSKAISSRGCTRFFIIRVLQCALKYCKSLDIAPVFPFKFHLVQRWLEDAKKMCQSHGGQLWEQFGGVAFDVKNQSTYWLEPSQFFCWWKNNIERRTKFAVLQRDADEISSAKNSKQFLRSLFCATIVALSTNIRQHFERNRYISQSYGDDSTKCYRISEAGPLIDPLPCLYHPPQDAPAIHYEFSRRFSSIDKQLVRRGNTGSSSYTDMDDRTEDEGCEEDVPYYSPQYQPKRSPDRANNQKPPLHTSSTPDSKTIVLYCTCHGGTCVEHAAPPQRPKKIVSPHAHRGRLATSQLSSDKLTSSSLSAFAMPVTSQLRHSPTTVFSQNKPSDLDNVDNSSLVKYNLESDRLSLQRPVPRRQVMQKGDTNASETTPGLDSQLQNIGRGFDEWLSEDFHNAPLPDNVHFNSRRVPTPASPLPFQTTESDMLAVFDGLENCGMVNHEQEHEKSDFDSLCENLMSVKDDLSCEVTDDREGNDNTKDNRRPRSRTFDDMHGFDTDQASYGTEVEDLHINTSFSPASCTSSQSYSEGIYGKQPKRSRSQDFDCPDKSEVTARSSGSLSCPVIGSLRFSPPVPSASNDPNNLDSEFNPGVFPEGWLTPTCTNTFANLGLSSSPTESRSVSATQQMVLSTDAIDSMHDTNTIGEGSGTDINLTDYFFFDANIMSNVGDDHGLQFLENIEQYAL